jgi:hypothetical protein
MVGKAEVADIEDLLFAVVDDLAPSRWREVGEPAIASDGADSSAQVTFPLNDETNGVHMNPSCDGKVKYASWARAKKDAKFSRIRWGDVLHPYVCKACGATHLGSGMKEQFDDEYYDGHFRADGAGQGSWSEWEDALEGEGRTYR